VGGVLDTTFHQQTILFFFQPDWYVEPDQKCKLPLVKNGNIGKTRHLIGFNKDNICTKLDGNPSMHM